MVDSNPSLPLFNNALFDGFDNSSNSSLNLMTNPSNLVSFSNDYDNFSVGDGIDDEFISSSANAVNGNLDGDGDGDDDDDDDDDDEDELDEELEQIEISNSTNDVRKRKFPSSETTKKSEKKKRKSKAAPSYKRRNIRSVLTTNQLQDDTLNALKAEQERLRRLNDTNSHFMENLSFFSQPVKQTFHHDTDCIVLGDDDDDGGNCQNEQLNTNLLSSEPQNSIMSNEKTDDHIDSDDSDVQLVESDTEVVNDKLSQKLRRLHVDDNVNIPDENGNVLVNVNHPVGDPDLYIAKHLCSTLKPHQIGGIRFMYDNIFESFELYRTTLGLGCILAHSMGCGKTLQVISFIEVLLRATTVKSILIVVPINTIQNWLNEFQRWCPIDDPNIDFKRPFQLYILNDSSKKFSQRSRIVKNWSETGGVLLIGYEMFRLLVTKKAVPNKFSSNSRASSSQTMPPVLVDLEEEEKNSDSCEEIRNVLINPDLVICDEGHRIKNHQASVALALKSIRSQRRIVLTGYPLQNNLIEYWCMVDFVRPNYLGSKTEFCNMFERPILNGQCIDSTVEDGKLMRARAHVLHTLLEGFIQRRGHDVLQADLPPKKEYVILLKLSPNQRQLYMNFLESVGVLSNSSEKTLNPLRAFAICCKIWNHADVLYKFVRDRQDANDFDLDFDFEPNSAKNKAKAKPTTSNVPAEKKDFEYDFANQVLNSYVCGQLSNGVKFDIALTIIEGSLRLGDKVLLFSQSLLSLNKFEEFLQQRCVPNTDKRWEKNVDYLRLDGSTSSLEREKLINFFNGPDSAAKLFLLSTRAGCLGINLIAANRVIVMDVSWNPCLDAQAVCRVYRYGQRKHCYIYRLIADFTMEKRIYDRQVAKQGMSDRVVDELQPQNQFTRKEVETLLHFALNEEPAADDLLFRINEITNDEILKETCGRHAHSITKVPFTHESLLCDRKEHQLTSAEKRRAQIQYNEEKMANSVNRSRLNGTRSFPRTFSDNGRRPMTLLMGPYPQMHTTSSMNSLMSRDQGRVVDHRLEELKRHGINVREITLRNELDVQLNSSERQTIPAGSRIHVIQGARGSYIRIEDGRFFAIRPPNEQPKNPAPTNSAMNLPHPQNFLPTTHSNIHSYNSPTNTVGHSATNLLNDMNNLNDQLDTLINEPVPNNNGSAFENLSSWQNGYFQQPQFTLNGFSQDQTSASTNNNELNSFLTSFTSNGVSFH